MKRFFAGLLLLLLVASQQAFSAIAIDNTSDDRINGGSTLNVSHATGNGSDRFMLVGISIWNSDLETVSSVTYSGQNLTYVGARAQDNDSRVEIWKLVNPPNTTSDVRVTFDGSVQNGAGAGVMTFTGVDQTNPHDAFQSNTGESGQASLAVTSAVNDLVFAVAAAEEQGSAMSISLGDQRWNYRSNNKIAGAGATLAGASTVNFRWNLADNDDWATGGVSINPSSGGGGPLPSAVLEYRFDECSLASGVTDTGGSYDGTANGSTESTDVEFRINRSLDLSATGTSDYVTLDSDAVNGLNSFSISTWIKTGISKPQQEIFQALGNGTSDDEIEIYLVGADQVRLNVGNQGSTVGAGKDLDDDNWHHLVVTRSGNNMCLYVDGSLANCHSSGGGSQISINNSSSVIIGQEQDAYGGNFDSTQAFEGYIDEFKIYSQVLSSTNIDDIYQNESNGDNADGSSRAAVSCSSFQWEGGSIELTVGSTETINFNQTYTSPVVFLVSMFDNPDPTHARLVSVSPNSADIIAVEPPDEDGSGTVTVNFIVAESGSYDLSDGTKIEVGTQDISDVQRHSSVGGSSGWATVSFTQSFSSAPVLITSLMSSNNDSGSFNSPWLSAAARNVTSSGFQAALERAEVSSGSVTQSESYGYLAVESGSLPDFVNSTTGLVVSAEAIRSGDTISHVCEAVNLTQTYSDAPDFVAAMNRRDGNNGGWARGCGATTATVSVSIDEDTYRDGERNHTNEDVGILVFGGAPDVSMIPAFAEYRFDEGSWNGAAGEVEDSTNSNDGSIVDILNGSNSSGHIQTIADGKICRAADIEDNSGDDDQYAVDTGIDVNDDLGNAGTISLWYRADADWSSSGNETLFNATSDVDKYFYLIRTSSGALQFGLEDTADTDFSITTSAYNYTSSDWVHIAVTWDMSDEFIAIYVDGALAQSQSITSSNGQLGDMLSLYIGDNRNDSYTIGGTNSAAGHIDEVVIFDSELSSGQVSLLYDNQNAGNNYDGTARGACIVGPDHYSISHGSNGVTCLSEQITITAHDSSHNPIDASQSTITITTDSGFGDWLSIVSGGGSLANGTANDGEATYTFASGSSSVVLEFSHTTTGTFGFNVTDGSVTETTGNAIAADDPNMNISNAVLKFVDSTGNLVNIGTQISGKDNSDVYLRAIEADVASPTSCGSSITGAQTIGFAATCENPSTCVSGQRFFINGAPINILDSGSTLGYTGVNVTFNASSISTSPITLNYEDAGLMRLNLSLSDPEMLGTSNDFVVRPFAFGFSAITASGAAMSLPAGDETGGDGFTSAGSDFDVTLNAYRYQSADDSNNDNIPDVGADVIDNGVTPNFTGTLTITPDSYTPAGGTLGNLSGTTTPLLDVYSNRAGADVTATLQYDEVGSVSIIAQMNDYLGDADADIQSVVTKIGRFYPHYIALSDVNVESSCSSFVYMQQPYSEVAYRLEARAANDDVTENYDIALYDTEEVKFAAEDSDNGTDLSSRLTTSSALSSWTAGEVNRTSSGDGMITDLIFTRNGGVAGFEDGPYEQLQLGIYLDPTTGLGDGVNFTSGTLNYDPDTAGACGASCTGVQIGSAFEALYGRLYTQSAHGPETEPLSVPFWVQYWDGSGFVTSDDDSCSVIPLSNITFDGNSIDTVANRTVTVGGGTTTGALGISGTDASPTSGDYGLQFTAPGAGNTGYFNLGISNVPVWLRYDWDQNGTADDSSLPDSLITFGRARGNDRMIFWQERYQ